MNRLQPLPPRREHLAYAAERSWGVRWSRSGVAFWHRRECFGPVPVAARPASGRGGWIAAGIVGVASIGLTAAGVVAGPVSSRSAASPLVSVRIPPVKPLARPSAALAEAQVPVAGSAVVKPAAHVIVAEVRSSTPPIEPTSEAPPAAGPLTREADAVDAALRSGRMHSWVDADAGVQGFAVVGPAATEGGETCRDLSILTKGDDGSRVSRDRRCVRS